MNLTIPAYRTSTEQHVEITSVNMRLPISLLKALRDKAEADGIPCGRIIREALEEAVAGTMPG